MKLIDVNGMDHQLTSYHISVMLAIGWGTFVLSYIVSVIFYVLHPSEVDFDMSRFHNRWFFYLCGKKVDIISCCNQYCLCYQCCKFQPVPTNDMELNIL